MDPKSIILFSDGTGNSSAKLFKTNVWRMYEAVDLGPPTEGKRAQVSYYDDGVGTSSFKPLTVLGGAFGVGLRRNVMDIYRYACRNYRDGDDIYAFGFSRGAFTIRLVVALIASQGLVRSSSEAELNRKSREAYRAFRADFLPRRLEWPTRAFRSVSRWIRGHVDHLKKREPYSREDNYRPDVRFVGVWDTVAAYGGPITEITRAIDNWIYPLSMPDYRLHPKVLCARQALALDDERDAFQPLLWDEVHERGPLGRLQQVWFTGMHADVGGGYPDESLSYVSLLWMMEEAEHAGLRTLTVIKDVFVALASSYGPIHDSRAGLGAYYRYQPRKISAWLEPVTPETLSLRDPEVADKHRGSHGLLRTVNLHESVINRIATGTDRYAPITLPERFNIIPPQDEGETSPQADNQTPVPAATRTTPLVSRELRERLTGDKAAAAARAQATEALWDVVWYRRLTYFATLAATLLLLLMPFYVASLPTAPFLADGRTWIGGIIRLLALILPNFAGEWIEAYADNPFYFFVFAVLVAVLMAIGTGLERGLRDRARSIWKRAVEGQPLPRLILSRVQRFRNNHTYQRFIQHFKWSVLPSGVGLLFVLLLFWTALGAFAQMKLPFLEDNELCGPSAGAGAPIGTAQRDFRTWDVCSESFGTVVKKERYVVTFDVVEPWSDSTLETSPEGLAANKFPFIVGYLAAPLKRVIDASYLQPVLEVRPPDSTGNWFRENLQIYPLQVRPVGDSATLYRGEFTVPRGGELFLFANDAMIPLKHGWGPFHYKYFYEASGTRHANKPGNYGTACVTVEHVSKMQRAAVPPPAGRVCRQAAERNAAQAAEAARNMGR